MFKKLKTGQNKVKKHDEKRLAIKLLLCLTYLIVITILFVCSYRIFEQEQEIPSWGEVKSVEDYTYIEVSKMSEKFAYYSTSKKQVHFVIEKEDTGQWHTYLIAINESDYPKFKNIIDYTYERTTEIPEPVKVYGYPMIMKDDLKALAIKNIVNFVPAENEVAITNENFEQYLTNSYLDTTQSRKDNFNLILLIVLLMLLVMIGLLIFTIFDRDKIVDNLDEKLEEMTKKNKWPFMKKNNKR